MALNDLEGHSAFARLTNEIRRTFNLVQQFYVHAQCVLYSPISQNTILTQATNPNTVLIALNVLNYHHMR